MSVTVRKPPPNGRNRIPRAVWNPPAQSWQVRASAHLPILTTDTWAENSRLHELHESKVSRIELTRSKLSIFCSHVSWVTFSLRHLPDSTRPSDGRSCTAGRWRCRAWAWRGRAVPLWRWWSHRYTDWPAAPVGRPPEKGQRRWPATADTALRNVSDTYTYSRWSSRESQCSAIAYVEVLYERVTPRCVDQCVLRYGAGCRVGSLMVQWICIVHSICACNARVACM